MNDTRNVTQDGQTDVDQEISSATPLEEDTNGWEDDGTNDLAKVAINLILVTVYYQTKPRLLPRPSKS